MHILRQSQPFQLCGVTLLHNLNDRGLRVIDVKSLYQYLNLYIDWPETETYLVSVPGGWDESEFSTLPQLQDVVRKLKEVGSIGASTEIFLTVIKHLPQLFTHLDKEQ